MQIPATYNALALLLNKCGLTLTIVYIFYYQLENKYMHKFRIIVQIQE